MKKLKLLFLCFALLSSSVITVAYADQSSINSKEIQISKDQAYYDNELNAYVVSFSLNGNNDIKYYSEAEVAALNKIDEQDHRNDLHVNEMLSLDGLHKGEDMGSVISPMADYREYYTFTRTAGPTKYIGSARKVSADITAPPGGGSVSKNISVTITETYSSNVTYSNQKSAIQAGAGFSWSSSATSGNTYTLNLLAGQSGYISFTPYYNKVDGTLKQYSNWDGLIGTWNASGYSVMKTYDGEADGMYQFVFK